MKFKVGDYVVFSNELRTHTPNVKKDNIARKVRYIDNYGRYTLESLSNNSFYEYELELANVKVDYSTGITLKQSIYEPLHICIMPDRYVINKGATVLFWGDGTKTIVKRSGNDTYDKRLGFLTAYFQKTCGMSKTKANKYLDSLVEQEIKEKKNKWNPKLKIKVSDEEIKQLDKIISITKTKYKIGDKVKVIYTGNLYTGYISWFEENNCKELAEYFAFSQYPDTTKIHKIVAIGTHDWDEEKKF